MLLVLMGCEDTVNIIRSSGSLKFVKLKNAESDGLDIDFSNIFKTYLKKTANFPYFRSTLSFLK